MAASPQHQPQPGHNHPYPPKRQWHTGQDPKGQPDQQRPGGHRMLRRTSSCATARDKGSSLGSLASTPLASTTPKTAEQIDISGLRKRRVEHQLPTSDKAASLAQRSWAAASKETKARGEAFLRRGSQSNQTTSPGKGIHLGTCYLWHGHSLADLYFIVRAYEMFPGTSFFGYIRRCCKHSGSCCEARSCTHTEKKSSMTKP